MKDPFVTHIDLLERRQLEGAEATSFDIARTLNTQSFLQIKGLADFWQTHPETDFGQCITDLIIGAHSQAKTFLTFMLVGTPRRLSVFLSLGTPELTQLLVEAVLPGVILEMDTTTGKPKVFTHLGATLTTHFREQSIISGIPSRKSNGQGAATNSSSSIRQQSQNTAQLEQQKTEGQGISHLERVIRGMAGATWAYVVRAYPRPRATLIEERQRVLNDLAQVTPLVKGQIQRSKQEGQTVTASSNVNYNETFSGEIVNYNAHYLSRLLEYELTRLERAVAVGQWTVDNYLGAATSWDVQRLSSLLIGTLAGKDSRPAPLRAHSCNGTIEPHHFKTYLSSEELSVLIQLPREEVPGYAIHDYAAFDVDFQMESGTALALGTIQQHAKNTYDTYRIHLNDLTKHAVVLGVTGSGKTTTIFNLLDHAIQAGVPFLVLEPAKTEYRKLHPILVSKYDIRIYTLGNEIIAPFRFNPFEFETSDTPGGSGLLNHIDFLKAVFNAAFILYAPMPYVLETALHEVYQDKGWDLASGLNQRLPVADWPKKRHLSPIYPTLTDLYRKVEDVTKRLGYYGEIEQNVIAGLKARIGSLRIGSKGFMLDTARGIPMRELLSYPTILELESIGNDDEKTFLMGLLLGRLYEYRRLQAAQGSVLDALQHLLVVEEAHRLFKQTQTQVDTEAANPRAQAIETFTNMLSEIRGYGQGVIVAEQIPSKLTPDLLKNTNLKIAHRLVAQDDRQSVGQTMNLAPAQLTHLGTFLPGIAAIYAEGADHAYLVRMENYKARLRPLADVDLEKESVRYASVEPYLSIPHIDSFGVKRTRFKGPDMGVYQDAGTIIETRDCQDWWASVLLSVLYQRTQLPDLFQQLNRMIIEQMFHLQSYQQDALRLLVLVRGAAEVLSIRGAAMGWTYPMVEKMRLALTQGLVIFFRTDDLALAASDLDTFAREYKMRAERKQGPYVGCVHCTDKCRYRLEVQQLLSEDDVRWFDEEIQALLKKTPHDYKAVAALVRATAERWLGGSHSLAPDVGYCGALHASKRLKMILPAQARLADELAKLLLV